MLVYGCDFSGAKDPSGKIYVTIGRLTDHRLTILEVKDCEDRLDLFYMIKNNPAPWGLDFPFSIPMGHLNEHYQSSWHYFIREAYGDTRMQFKSRFGKVHSGKNNLRDCRVTDIAVNGKSPISETPISMNGMLYGGRKLLFNLLNDVSIYPFDSYREDTSRLYEVYPSHGWSKLGLNREDPLALAQISDFFKRRVDSSFDIELDISKIPKLTSGDKIGRLVDHASDSVMACIVLAYSLYRSPLDALWNLKPSFASDEEWALRGQEGLVVRYE